MGKSWNCVVEFLLDPCYMHIIIAEKIRIQWREDVTLTSG